MLNSTRLISLGSAGALATGLALVPLSAGADQTPVPLGSASAATVSLQISPRAVLNLPTNLLSGLPLGAGDVLGGALQNITINLDSSSAQGVLNQARSDLTSGHSLSRVVDVNIAGLNQLVDNLGGVVGSVTNGLPNVASLVPGLPSQLSSLTGSVGNLTGALAGINIHRLLEADLVKGPVAQAAPAVSVPLPGGNLDLAPLDAIATDVAHLTQAAVSAPQAEAHNTTEALTVGPTLNLASLLNLPVLQSLMGQVNQVIASLQGVVANPTGTTGAAISSLPAGLGSTITGQLAQAGVTLPSNGPVPPAVTGVLNGDIGQLQTLLGNLTALQSLDTLLGQLQLNKLVTTNGITSASRLEPQSNGVHALASSTFTDLQILPLGSELAGALKSAVGVPLLEIKGATSSAEAFVDGSNTDAPKGSSRLGEIDVLGNKVVDLNTVIPPGTSKTITVPVLGSALTLQVTAGVPQITNSTAGHKTVHVAALEVDLLNGLPNGTGAIPLLSNIGLSGRTAATAPSNAIVSAQLASSSVDAQAAGIPGQVIGVSSPLPKTGKLGPFALAVAGALVIVAMSLRLMPGVIRRAGHRVQQ